ncbi:MAG: Ig-like domain-containing protein, partial [Oscillospiraceae bacterium]|nr:Ig-like domain-containing protein [Oscillospiraceae bacterium]
YNEYDAVMYDFTDSNGEVLANNSKILLEIAATGVYEGDTTEVWSVPITIDTEAPELLGAKVLNNTETGEVTLELTFRDNLSVSVVGMLSSDGSMIYALDTVDDVIPDEEGYQNYTVSYDLTGLSGKIMLVLSDYALNEAYYGINLGGEGASYGDLVAYQYNYETGLNGWVSFDADVNADETTVFISENDFVCAEYVGGFVFAQTESGALYGIRYEDMLDDTMLLEATYITQLNNVYQDLAYSYAEGKLYGLYTYVDGGYPTTEINSINLNGEYYDPNMWSTIAPYQEDWVLNRGGLYGLTLACDDAGSLYVLGLNYDWDTEELTETAHLWTVGMEYDEWSDSYMLGWSLSEVGDTGLSMDYLQSMTWDHNTEKMYWARFDASGIYNMECELVEVNPETAECTKVGTLSGETCALFAPLTSENAAKDEHSRIPDMDSSVVGTPLLRDSAITMNVGSSMTLGYDFDPWYTDYKEVVWSSDNTEAVTVDANGTITAVGTGSATITAANKADETKLDTVTVEVTALDLTLEGVISAQEAGLGNVTGTSTYKFEMLDGVSSFGTVNPITASDELNFGLSLATSELGRGSLWACEYGNTGMIYEIDPETGEVKDVLQPIDGDMMFGLSYSESMDTFTAIMNFYLYTDLELTHEETEKINNSYDENQHMFTYHRVNMLNYLIESNTGFVTGETGQGASSEVVFCGITSIDGGIKDSYDETFYYDTYKDFMGNWAYSGSVNYQPTQTLVLLDNVGRLWYIDEVAGMSKSSDEWGNVFYTSADGMSNISFYGEPRNGIFEMEMVDDEGNVTYNVFNIRQIIETPLTDMFREGTMPRITYHFSDIEFAGYTAEGDPMFAMSLYDYWNNGTTNELYLFIPGHMTDEIDYETWENIYTPSRLFNLGNTGEYNIIASIHSATVTGGVDPEETVTETEAEEINPLAVGIYTDKNENR